MDHLRGTRHLIAEGRPVGGIGYINSYEHGGIVWTHFYGNRDFPLRADARAYPLPWIFGDVWVAGDAAESATAGHRRAADGERGELVIERPYPYLARTVWGDPERLGRPDWAGDRARCRPLQPPARRRNPSPPAPVALPRPVSA